tara:strand:- start:833 stop:940 length:108 start_codon:yes stop_codon:yes gene_type:complete
MNIKKEFTKTINKNGIDNLTNEQIDKVLKILEKIK